MDLPGKESAQGLGPQLPHKRFGDDVQRKVPGVGEQPGPKVEEGAVGKAAVPAEDGNVVQVPVFVAKEHIRLEQSGEVFSKPVKARELPSSAPGWQGWAGGRLGLASRALPLCGTAPPG